MIIILGLFLLACLSFLIYYLQKKWEIFGHWHNEDGWAILGWCFIFILIVVLICLPLIRISMKAEIVKFKSVQITLEEARQSESISEFELAAIQQKVVDSNRWLANAQFWKNHPLTKWFWPGEINELESIK